MRADNIIVTTCIATAFALVSPRAAHADSDGGVDVGADPSVAASAGVELSATITQVGQVPDGPVPLGTPISITFEIRHPLETEVMAPETWEPGRWELIESERTQVPTESGLTTSYRAIFSVFRPGETTYPALVFQVVDRADGVTEVQSTPFTAKFVAGLTEVLPLKDPQPSVALWVDDYTLAWVGGFAGAALLGGLIAYVAFGRREEELIAPPPRPAHEVALEKLAALAGDNLVERGEYMIFYVRLSEAVREYVGRLHRFPGTELTTSEIAERLEKVVWPRGLTLTEVVSLLQHCDEVKFAGRFPSEAEAQEALRRSFTVVELTRPKTDEASSVPAAQTDDDTTELEPKQAAPEPVESRWAPPSQTSDEVEAAAEDSARAVDAVEQAPVDDTPADKEES